MEKKIMIADDDVAMLKLLKQFLKGRDYNVVTASDGTSGLELFQQEKPDYVLLDIQMPGISGEELLTRIKKISPSKIAIIMTGQPTFESVRRMFDAGCDGYLVKPISDLEIVLLTLRQAEERQRIFRQNVLIKRMAVTEKEAILDIANNLLEPVMNLQENYTALRTCLDAESYDDMGTLLAEAEAQLSGLENIIQSVGRFGEEGVREDADLPADEFAEDLQASEDL